MWTATIFYEVPNDLSFWNAILGAVSLTIAVTMIDTLYKSKKDNVTTLHLPSESFERLKKIIIDEVETTVKEENEEA